MDADRECCVCGVLLRASARPFPLPLTSSAHAAVVRKQRVTYVRVTGGSCV